MNSGKERLTMRVYNTLTGEKEQFKPLTAGVVKMYVCGITAYDVCHLGHARSAVVFDMVVRYLRHMGYKVTYIKNFTDIDDKIIARAQLEQKSTEAVAETYIQAYYEDMDELGVMRADIEPRATEHIAEIIQAIGGLIQKQAAYSVDGDVFFDVSTFEHYGRLSGREKTGRMSGARVDVDTRKRNPDDFALWKASKEGEPKWESPWGYGRPGWHIECSVMSMKYLGQSFDIHGGGADLIFPHHENEIAQSEALTEKPFVKYWMHNGFITVNREKMSKSLGNFFTIKEILKKYDPEVVRFFLLSTHYRSPIEFSDEQLREAEATLDRVYSTSVRMYEFLKQKGKNTQTSLDESRFKENVEAFFKMFEEAMEDDFNSALALGHMFELIREINRFLDTRPKTASSRELVKQAQANLNKANLILNLFQRSSSDWYSALKDKKGIPLSQEAIEQKIKERAQARQQKDWVRADGIRQELRRWGIVLEDSQDGTSWKVELNVGN
jgi:cysteinyl-tRNA synthetase